MSWVPRTAPGDSASLVALLQYEADLRRQATEIELIYFLANETRRLIDYGQLFVLQIPRVRDAMQVVTASGLAMIDRNAPLIHEIERAVDRARSANGDGAMAIDAHIVDTNVSFADFPFAHLYFQPLHDIVGEAFAGLLIAGDMPLEEKDRFRLDRIADTAGHGWRALKGPRPIQRVRKITRRERRGIAVALGVLALIPVRLSALAPVEVVADRPFTLSAPFSGVIQRIEIAPNSFVRTGQPLVRFDDVRPRNELTLATERLAVARARVERASSAAFGAAGESREIAIMQAERDLAQAEYDYARDLLAQSVLKAPRNGIAIYSDRRDFEGRAVNVGDPIVQITDPRMIRYRIDLPAAEQFSVERGSPVKIWLDGQPLWALGGQLESASYAARKTAGNVLAFALVAKPIGGAPDIGARGTARVEGNWVPLIYSVLRRPISALRQTIGY
ncbi:efflux RND transporter periplasmic adaptor subunit [Sphingomonas prati]|uniref:Multidrug resistance efflux pump n=1 Tax=Sphingomonas prati TaxID=1843237 RepID=A0A7W9BVE9_9SPHN|nr:HlyD family efflux transporter periplasmic adaptor subunit [Sphingomonas prati]MBB5730867.1 multidrug resistance efflux pump [Sphingomonas prati]GGE97069.1 hypothetical protein GCM10011404_32800 [Sphingomonas prati]